MCVIKEQIYIKINSRRKIQFYLFIMIKVPRKTNLL